jgi:hypothetical protein
MSKGGWMLALLAVLSSAEVQAQSPESHVRWRAPSSADVAWRGMLNAEGSGVGMGPQIGPYVVPGAVGLVAAIMTHAAIAQGVSSNARKREQEDADRVLEPYAQALREQSANLLWSDAAALVAGPPVKIVALVDLSEAAPITEVMPVFTMSQDQEVLVLDAVFREAVDVGTPPRDLTVRVVSTPLAVPEAAAYWLADGGQRIRASTAAMLAHAFEVAQRHGSASASELPMKTHRYLQGSRERTERGQQLASGCGRAVLRSLRGGLLSVPVRIPADRPCEASSVF